MSQPVPESPEVTFGLEPITDPAAEQMYVANLIEVWRGGYGLNSPALGLLQAFIIARLGLTPLLDAAPVAEPVEQPV